MDPTKDTRRAVAEAVVPKKSPLGQSLEEQRIKEEEQLAIDEANNLVMQRGPVQLPEEAQNFVNPEITQSQPQEVQFVSQGQATPQRSVATEVPLQSPASSPIQVTPDVPVVDTSAIDTVGNATRNIDQEIARINEERAAAIQKKIDEDAQNVDKIEPKNFFTGKSTWQKILGGVGLFLGSITPEGARNVANIIDKEIERDIEAQKMNIKLKRDTQNANYEKLLQKYGSQEGALLAKKKSAYEMLDLHLKKLELSSRNAETRARLSQGREELDLKRQSLNQELMKEMMKQTQEAKKGSLIGYQGTNSDPAIVRGLVEQQSAMQRANSTLSDLENLLKEGSKNPFGANKALAEQTRDKLAADMAKAMFGRSSDSELAVAKGLIPDVSSWTQRGGIDKKLLDNLRTRMQKDFDISARAAGYSRPSVPGARKIQ